LILSELEPNFYVQLGLDYRARLVPGQVCIAPVLYCYENREIWRPFDLDNSQTSATVFRLVPQPGDAYQSQRLLQSPQLGVYEEFPVVRAKRRPVIVLMPQQDEVEVRETRGMMRVNKKLVTVAPCYSVVNAMNECKTDPRFLIRVGMLEFPHFMFLPQGGSMDRDSLLRLDSIHHVFHSQLEPTQWTLSGGLFAASYSAYWRQGTVTITSQRGTCCSKDKLPDFDVLPS
jgi:hypothetical protein